MKDFKDYTKSKYVLISIIMLPIILGVLVPFEVLLYSGSFRTGETFGSGFGQFLDKILSRVVSDWSTFTDQTKALISLSYIMLLVVSMIPIIITSAIASETIAGEKERKTIESLLTSPLRESEIVTGKIISSFLPSMVATIISVISFSIVMDILLYPQIGRIFFPEVFTIIILLVISPLITKLAVELLIMISTRVSTVRDANQLGGILLIPLIMVVLGFISLYFFNSLLGFILTPIVLLILDGLFYKLSTNLFQRERER
ncbi:MAG: ABC transporter permease subunit [Candidatus Heimdallarchaeaceae archaeon]